MKYFFLCVLNMIMLAIGQTLFKYAAQNRQINSLTDVLDLVFNFYMISAVFLYGLTTVLWVYILTKVPLSYAYPIQVIAFPLVVFISFAVFKETVPANRWIGVGIIVVGAFVATR